MSVYDFSDYKDFINQWITAQPRNGRGLKMQISEHLSCHNAYISQVLSGEAHLSVEQAERLISFLGLGLEEGRFFLFLVQKGRAGTLSLRKFFEAEIKRELEHRQIIKNRITYTGVLSQEDQARYYSAWYYGAIHIAVSLPQCRTLKGVSQHLGISMRQAEAVLKFLLGAGLIEERDGGFVVGAVSIHLPSDSPMISRHHVNWRLRAMQSLADEDQTALHYSSAVTISAEDLPKVKEILIQAIQSVRNVVRESPKNEKLYCYLLDAFELGRVL